ncbi:MAG TPA: type II CAAX endopeptidase family protein [Pyrinomonadaceae bacterium]|nr:type II CAAX endopeptidase family protein [Pyrinomonadaceae bacterium]
MDTETSPQQATPLDQEWAPPPAPTPGQDIQSTPVPDPRERWLAWLEVAKAVVLWATSFILLVSIPVITALPYAAYRILTLGAEAAKTLPTDKMLLFFSVLGILPAHLLTLAVIWMVMSEGGRQSFWKTIGFEWPTIGFGSPKGLSPTVTTLACVVLALVLFGLAQLVSYIYGDRKTDLDLLIESSIYARIATAFMATATAPLVEEVIYRGVLYRALEKAAGIAVAIPVVSLLFAGVHVWQYRNNIAVIIVITVLSIVLTVSRALTGKMLPAFIIHLAFNGIQSIFIVLGGFIDTDPTR